MTDEIPQSVLESRIRLAREFKVRTCGEYLTPDVFDELDSTAPMRKRKRFTADEARERKRLANKRDQFSRKVSIAVRNKERDGTYGVTLMKHAAQPRWRAHLDQRVIVHACAIEAAMHRNEYMGKQHPGYPMFQVDIDAVWQKWGCACGKHARGKHAH